MENKLTYRLLTLLTVLTTCVVMLVSFSLLTAYSSNTGNVSRLLTSTQKPDVDYLKSVTVQIMGEVTVEDYMEVAIEEFIEKFKKFFGIIFEDSEDLTTKKWTGTGFVIKKDKNYTYILTNAHVAGKEFSDKQIYVKNGNRYQEAEVMTYHNTLDMAVLKLKGDLKDKIPVKGFTSSRQQDRVFVMGHHLGRPYIYGEGVNAGYDGLFTLMQLPCLYGNSGSGVFNERGEVVAIVFAISNFGWEEVDETHAITVDGISIKFFLEKLGLV